MINRMNFSMPCYTNNRVGFGNQKLSKHVQDVIDFTTAKKLDSLKVMKLAPEFNTQEPTSQDLDALEKAMDNRKKWNPSNKEFFEDVIKGHLEKNGRNIDNY